MLSESHPRDYQTVACTKHRLQASAALAGSRQVDTLIGNKHKLQADGLHYFDNHLHTHAGGHLNPAITLGFLLGRKITAQRALFYWAAQASTGPSS